DADGSAEQGHHLIAGRADAEDGFAGVEGADARESNDRSPLVGAQAAEQRAIAEKVTGFLEHPFVRTHAAVPTQCERTHRCSIEIRSCARIDRAVNQKRSRACKSLCHMTVI